MKKITFLLFLCSVITFGQQKIVTKKHTTTHAEIIDYSKIYQKTTGKKIKKKEFLKILKKYPNLQMESVIGADGSIEKYLVDLSKQNKKNRNNRIQPVLKGEVFPNFIAKTVENNKIELNKFKGKTVILRFELEANTFRFKKEEIKQLDGLINQVKNKNEKVKAVIFFASDKEEVRKGFNIPNSNFQLIANALNFHDKFSITRFPTTIIIDKNGVLVDYYKNIDDIDLEKIMPK